MDVVGTMFFKDNKLLIDKPRKRLTYQMVGGKVEKGETPMQAAIRECHEELGEKAIFDESLFNLTMEFDEIATSDGITPIHFYVFTYKGELKGDLNTSEEIERFKWYETKDGNEILSNTLKNEVVPYCIKNGLGSRKTMNLPGTVIRLPGLAEKDIADLKAACEHDYDFVAISFARNLDDVRQVRKVLDENGGKDIQILTKVENVEGLSNLNQIIDLADGQMIARGDMATETDFTEPPVVQKRIIRTSNKLCKPAITATQMLESMTHQPLPTRAEASDVANAIYDRTSAIMLSGECAQGDYPVGCVKTMAFK